jgi:hypothetical protein
MLSLNKNKLLELFESMFITSTLFFLYLRLSDQSGTDEDTATHWVFSFIAPYALLLAAGGLLVLCIFRLFAKKQIMLKGILLPYLFSLLMFILRVFDLDQLIQSFAGLIVVFMFFLLTASFKNAQRQLSYFCSVERGFFLFIILLAVTTLFLYAQGLGFYNQGFRFSGLSFHPNQFGLICALGLIYLFGVAQESGLKKTKKFNTISLIAVMAFFLLASGSRGGVLAATVGLLFVAIGVGFRFRQIIIVTLVIPLAYVSYSFFAEQSDLVFSRFTENTNNRSEVFEVMFSDFLSSPLIGLGIDAAGSENSYLKALAIGGLMCGLPLIYFAFRLGFVLVKNLKFMLKQTNPLQERQLKFSAMMASILVASMFDGYLFEKFGFTTFLLIIILSSRLHHKNLEKNTPVKSKTIHPLFNLTRSKNATMQYDLSAFNKVI